MTIKYSQAYSLGGDFGARGVISPDINGDGLPDVAATSSTGNRVNVYLANGDGTFGLGSTLTASGGSILSTVALDGNKDGKVDLITADHSTGGVYFYQAIGGGKFSAPAILGTVGQAHTLAYADFDKNGYLDIATSGYSSSQVLVVRTGSNFVPLSTVNLASGGGWARGLTVGDFNRDGNTDLVVTNVNFNNAIIFYGPSFSTSRTLSTGSYPIGAIAGDFNGDGQTDFTTSNYADQSLSFFLQQNDGSFIRSDVSLKGRPSDFPKVADVDGDRIDEVIVGQSESYQGVAVVALPTSGTAAVEYYATASNVQDVFVNDINGDGKPDFGAAFTGGIVQYQNLNLGTPTYVITSSAPSVNEGTNVTFTIDTKNVEWGKTVPYTLTGISQSDLASGSLTGTATVSQNGIDGRATVSVTLASDQTTEANETLTITVQGQTASTTIVDTSTTPAPQLLTSRNRSGDHAILLKPSRQTESEATLLLFTDDNRPPQTSVIEVAPAELAASNWVLMPQEGDPKAFWLVKSTFIATNNNAGEVVFSAQGVGDATALSDATSSEFTARMEQLFSVRPENFPLDQEVIDIRIHDLQNDKVLITWTTQNLTSGKLSLYGAIARSPAVEQPVEDYASQLSNLDNDWFVITDQERPLAAEREVSVAPQIGGTFFVSWTAVGSSNRDTDVFGAFFSETGQRFSAPFELSSDSSASQSMPSARMLDTGHVSVIWIEKKFDITNIVQETLSLGQTDAVASPIMNIPSTRTVVDRPIALAYAGSSRVYWLEGFADPYFGGDLANLEYAWFSTARPANRQVVTNLSPDQIQFGYLERDWTDLVQMAMSEIAGQIDNQLFSDTSARPIVLVEQKTPSRYQASFSLPDQRGIVKTTAKGSGFSYNEKDIDQNDRDFVLNEYTASVYADSDDVEPLSEFFLSGNFEVKDGDFTQFSISKIGLNIGNGLRATVLGYLDLNQGKLSSDRFELKIELDDLSLEAGSLSDVSLSVLLSDYGFDLVNNQVLRGKIQQVGLVVDHNDRIDYLLGNGLDLGILVSKPGASLLENGGSLFDESNGILIRSDKDTWPGNGVVTGSAGRDALFGLAGNDTLISLGGNDTLDGGLGIDNAVLPGKRSEYLVDWDVARASLTLSRGAAEQIVLKDIEFINFSDTFYSLKDVLLANRVGAHAVYRFYDPGRELHIYTRLGSEFEQLFAAQTLSSTADVDTYRFEGVAFGSTEANDFAYYAVDSSSVNWAQQSVAQLPTFRAQAVFRLYNPRDNSHFLSVNNQEISQKTATGWTVDGVAFNAFPDRPGLVPIRTGGESSLEAIFAFQNAFTGDFVYLPQQEKLPLGSDSTWVSRGLAFWVPRDLGYDQQINGASAAETLSGEGGHDRIFGGKGDDQLNGGIGHDSLFGEGGSDRLKGYIGDDFLDGGEGIDTAVFNGPISAYAISFDPSNARFRFVSTEEGTDTVINVERFSFADGVFDAAQLPTQSRAGMIYHWKSHALLPGVTVAGLDPKSIQPDGADRFDLRAATLNPANNTLSVELWMNNRSQSVSNFGFTSQTTGASAASFVSALDNAAWNLNINTANPNRVVVAAFMKNAVDSVTGSVKLGTLQFTLAAGATAFLNFANVEIGKDRTPDAQLIMRPGSLSTGPDGRYAVSNLPFLDQELSVQRGVSDGSPKGGVTAADALAALMLAVELNPNLDPDGTGPMKAPRVSPYQVIAADVNQDGVVSSIDAFTILKMAVGLSEAPPPAWFFVPESRDFWDETQGQFTIDRLNASWDPRIIVPATQSQANLVGVIRGDVNGSWALESPNTVDATNPTHFQNLATLLAVPLDQWGIAPGG